MTVFAIQKKMSVSVLLEAGRGKAYRCLCWLPDRAACTALSGKTGLVEGGVGTCLISNFCALRVLSRPMLQVHGAYVL